MESRKVRSKEFDMMKFILILGVLMIHSNVSDLIPHTDANLNGRLISAFLSVHLGSLFVPGFFILSGFFFFRNVRKFTWGVYKYKLSSRIKTLLVPYLIWNTLCCGLLYIKFRYLGQPGLGVFTPDGVNLINLLKGYIYLPIEMNMPYAFAFWFLRNLIVFVILSPLAWIIGSSRWLTAGLLILTQIFFVNLYGFQWFVIGAFIAIQHLDLDRLKKLERIKYDMLFLVLILTAVEAYIKMESWLWSCLFLCDVLLALTVIAVFCNSIIRRNDNRLLEMFIKSTFFLYAFHQTFVTQNRLFAISICGDTTNFQVVCSTLLSFLIFIIVSFTGYIVLKRLTPRLLEILTGGRD